MSGLTPVAGLAGGAYAVPRAGAPCDLRLDSNEGAVPPDGLIGEWAPEALRTYPDAGPLERDLAHMLGIAAERVLVTAGADECIDRACRAMLAPGREIVLPVPGFEMTRRYAEAAGATIVEVDWPDAAYPTDAVLAAVTDATAMIVVTSPNNPTGGTIAASELSRLCAAVPAALVLVDLAYIEFADEDLTAAALGIDNALVLRTFSKAWGLAGLRVGYAAGPERVIGWLRSLGGPYPVSAVSLEAARRRLAAGDGGMAAFVASVRQERGRLEALLRELGARPRPSQANFVFAEVTDPVWVRDAMAGLGIAIRAWPGAAGVLGRAIRIGLPGSDEGFARLEAALRTVFAPQALLWDMDGVLADVRRSYRAAIARTAASFGVAVSPEQIAAAKARGNANNDWVLTQRLCEEAGVAVPLSDVTAVFEELYQNELCQLETLIPRRELLDALAERLPMAVVTGRPRKDCEAFLERFQLGELFAMSVCMEDAEAKPSPEPVRCALAALGVQRAWMLGDTPDDARAARAARVLPLGFGPVQGQVAAGAARVLDSLDELAEQVQRVEVGR